MIILVYINNYIELLRLYYIFFSFIFEVVFEFLNVFSYYSYVYRCYIVLYCIIFIV